jgi:hypothetical protein
MVVSLQYRTIADAVGVRSHHIMKLCEFHECRLYVFLA